MPRQPSPQSRQTYVGACYSPIIRGFDDLNIVDSHDAASINVDHLLVQARRRASRTFSIAPHERPQIEDVRTQADAVFSEVNNAPARQKKFAPAITRDKARDRR